MNSVKTVGSQKRNLTRLGTSPYQSATVTAPALITTNLQGLNVTPSGVAAARGGL